jgi:glycerol transport system ATP-binding protein
VRLSIADVGLSAILAEGEPVPSSDVRVNFDPAKINVYADDWRVAPLEEQKGEAA